MSRNERAFRAKLAAHARWARTSDGTGATAAARAALYDRFQREVDPDNVLSPQERARRADHAWKAHFARLALRSVQARQRSAGREPEIEGKASA